MNRLCPPPATHRGSGTALGPTEAWPGKAPRNPGCAKMAASIAAAGKEAALSPRQAALPTLPGAPRARMSKEHRPPCSSRGAARLPAFDTLPKRPWRGDCRAFHYLCRRSPPHRPLTRRAVRHRHGNCVFSLLTLLNG